MGKLSFPVTTAKRFSALSSPALREIWLLTIALHEAIFVPIAIATSPFSVSNPISNWDRRLQVYNRFRLAIRDNLQHIWNGFIQFNVVSETERQRKMKWRWHSRKRRNKTNTGRQWEDHKSWKTNYEISASYWCCVSSLSLFWTFLDFTFFIAFLTVYSCH